MNILLELWRTAHNEVEKFQLHASCSTDSCVGSKNKLFSSPTDIAYQGTSLVLYLAVMQLLLSITHIIMVGSHHVVNLCVQ